MYAAGIEIAPDRDLRFHITQRTVNIIQPQIQRIVFADRQAKIHACAVTLQIIRRQIVIFRVVMVVEHFAAKADAINGVIRVSGRDFDIGLIGVARAAETDRITAAQPVVLRYAQLITDAAVGAITQAHVECAGVTLFNFIHHINLIR
ncbi:hypothetical protein SRABI106_02705 [Rahnella aquatilis]|nr:hypothetical protein SRABI106_02705 [Rahnella aquatilis]